MKNNTRNEFIGAKATLETKNYFKKLKQDTGKSLADILEIMADSEVTGVELNLLYRQGSLQEQLNSNEKVIRRLEDTLEFVKKQNENILLELKGLEKNKPKRMSGNIENIEDNLKRSVSSYYRVVSDNTNSFGFLKPTFDSYKVGRTLCLSNNVDFLLFNKCVDMIDSGEMSLDDFVGSDLSERGIL